MRKVLFMLCVLLLAACEGGSTAPTSGTPFLGGSEGIVISFLENSPPAEVFDGGQFPFDAVVKLENKGEWDVTPEQIEVRLVGFDPAQFGRTPADLVVRPDGELRGLGIEEYRREVSPAYAEFANLNYQSAVPGAELSFPMRAEACYLYGTFATAQLCTRENLINPRDGGLCNPNEPKEVFNSGAPVQVSSLKQHVRSRDKIGFDFTITHPGSGEIYERGHLCDVQERRWEDRVYVEVDGLPGVTCSGLSEGDTNRGFTTLHADSKTITCTYPVRDMRDAELPVKIILTYDYKDTLDTNVVVRHSRG